jgi:quercetin dioxygenase-like cupin family protein
MLVQVLSGEVEVSEPGDVVQVFHAGQVFFIPQGTVHAMKAENGFRAYRVSVSR